MKTWDGIYELMKLTYGMKSQRFALLSNSLYSLSKSYPHSVPHFPIGVQRNDCGPNDEIESKRIQIA